MATTAHDIEAKSGAAIITTVHESSHHSGKRLRQFLRPNGRRVHIAQTPEDQARLKKELHPSEDFDVYIHGTDEHARSLFSFDAE
jgi:hypothetical protein